MTTKNGTAAPATRDKRTGRATCKPSSGRSRNYKSCMTVSRWEKVLSRWSEAEETGPQRMMIKLVAMAIDEEIRQTLPGEQFQRGYFAPGGAFDYDIAVLFIDVEFAREQIRRAMTFSLELAS